MKKFASRAFGHAAKQVSLLPIRHCERSEAIQGPHHAAPRLLRRSAPRNDGKGVASLIDSVVSPRRLSGRQRIVFDQNLGCLEEESARARRRGGGRDE